ncbi:MAG: hypothetical protein KR126chlam3_00874 [Chlamydiae bacterium]|nr:hypothetical protein [Chlamydiota bacterium]
MRKELEKKIRRYLSHPYCLIALGLLPCFLVVFSHFASVKKLTRLTEEALYLKEKQQWIEKKKSLQQDLLMQMQKASSDYLENEIESLQFMLPEIQKLRALLHCDPSNETHLIRLDNLENGQNALRFRQQNFQRVGKFQEMDAIQQHPVEVNREDLKTLLARIENVQIGSTAPRNLPPDLQIKNFELIKKPLPVSEEIFLVNLELIKREIINDK